MSLGINYPDYLLGENHYPIVTICQHIRSKMLYHKLT